MEQQLEAILAAYPQEKTAILPILHDVQAAYGYLPEEVMLQVARHTRVPDSRIYGIATFYEEFQTAPHEDAPALVCEGPVCQHRGAAAVMAAVEAQAGSQAYRRAPCLGMCEHAPTALHNGRPAGSLTPDTVPALLAGQHPEPEALAYGQPQLILQRVYKVDPSSLADYEAHGGYHALRKALVMSPEEVITAVTESGIVGRGGAMFPVGAKWRFTGQARGAVKHIVVNADESEPGTFKDRVLLEDDPFAVIESATLAGYAIGAEKGWIFIRGEYLRGYGRLHHAIHQARAAGYLGRNILGRDGFNFDIELRRGAGAYICGEETALFAAIEGERGYPRIKPPFPTTHGLFRQPTAINNVETLVAVMVAFDMSVAEWRQLGTEKSPGTKLFCVSGDVAQPGVYELPFGLTVRELITMAGGVVNGQSIQAVLMGGAAGKFIGPDKLDMPLTNEDSRAWDVPLGSGVVMVLADTADLRRILYDIAHFFAHESCGQCFPCRMGTNQQVDILRRIAQTGELRPGDRKILLDVGQLMTRTSLCGLGHTAGTAVMSAIELWPELVERDAE